MERLRFPHGAVFVKAEVISMLLGKEMKMKKFVVLLLCVLFLVVSAGTALADDSASHTVTLTVAAVDDVTITGGNVTLLINSGTGGVLDDATDSSTSLDWGTNQTNRRITVQSSLNSAYTLTVAASAISGQGTAPGTVTLSTTAEDFVTGINAGFGECTLLYTGSADFTDGTGTEVHTVTYTITAT